MISKDYLELITPLLKTAGYHEPFMIHPLSGGGNNRVFLIRHNEEDVGVLKEYYHHEGNVRDRLASEWNFSKFLWGNKIRQIPEPISSDPAHFIAIYGFINGNKLTPGRIARAHIDQAVNFYFLMNSFRKTENARQLLNAQEACFSLSEHIQLTDRRILNLKNISGRSQIETEARRFIDDELLPAWSSVRNTAHNSALRQNLSLNEQIPLSDRRLSPSDFGFHNALENSNGNLFFIDFEYAGWDDPAKMVCDFFCQPAIPVPEEYFPEITEKIANNLNAPHLHRQRIGLLLPVYQIKWCCIILNEFLPRGKTRRIFMDTTYDAEETMKRQLEKAKKIIHNLYNGQGL